MWADEVTYTFTTKSWGDSGSAWASGKDGNQFSSGRGVQVTTGATGANATTKNDFENVTKIVVTYSTNASKGTGNVSIQVGSNAATSKNVTAVGTTDHTLEYTYDSPQSGAVKLTVTCGQNSIYIKSVAITHTSGGGGSSVDAPDFSPASGAVEAGTKVTLTQASADEIRYTVDGTEPTKTTGTIYSSPIVITEATTIKAIAIEDNEVSSVASASYTITVTAPTYNIESSSSYLVGTGITLTSAGNSIYYKLTTDGTTPDNPTDADTEYTGPIALTSGTVKIKAIAYDAYGNTSSVVSRTVTGVSPSVLPFGWMGSTTKGKEDFTSQTGVVGYSLGEYAAGNAPYRLQLNADGDYIEIFTNERPYVVSLGVKMIGGGSTSTITVQESTDGVEFSNVEDLTISGAQNDVVNLVTSKDFAITTRVVKLLFTKGSNVGIGSISIIPESLPVTVGAAGYTTMTPSTAVTFPSGVKGYIVTATGANTVTLVEKASVPASTPIIIEASAGTYNLPVITTTPEDVSDNILLASDGTIEGDGSTIFALGNKSGVGFYLVANGQTVPAGKAYLSVPAAVKGFLAFDFGNTDAIKTVQGAGLKDAAIFNLAGQRMSRMHRGVNLVNGKKIILK